MHQQRSGAGDGVSEAIEGTRSSRTGRTIVLALAGALAIALIVVVLLRVFVLSIYYIPSVSMDPTFETGDRIIVNRLDTSPERGDVVVHRRADGNEVVQRVVAVGGETVRFEDGRLFIDDEPIDEPYLGPDAVTEDVEALTVPPGRLYVLGDNRMNSADSRLTGPVPVENVVGTVLGG